MRDHDELRDIGVDPTAPGPDDGRAAHSRPVSAAITEQAGRDPDATALREQNRRLTYAELDAAVGSLANRLTAAGVDADSRVAVLLERSAEHAIAVLAALRLGADTVLLDPADEAATTADKLAATATDVLVTRSGLAGMVSAESVSAVLAVDANDDSASGTSPTDGLVDEARAEGRLLLFGAGSTGTPVAAMFGPDALGATVEGLRAAYDLTPADRSAWSAAAGSAFGLAEWLPFLAAGAEVVVVDAATAGSPARLRDRLSATGVTHAFLDVERAERLIARRSSGGDLRVVTVYGGRLRRMPRDGLPFAVVNGYGSAETGGPVLLDAVGGVGFAGSVGGVRLHVLDDDLAPVPAGGVGALYAAGPRIAVAYHGDPARTAAAFVRHALPDEPARLLLRTADLARRRADGGLDVLGRAADLTADGEPPATLSAEAAALAFPEVAEAAALVADGVPTLYVVRKQPDAPHDRLAGALADETGCTVVVLPALPRLVDGRPSRRELLALTPGRKRTGITARPQDAHLPFPLTDTQQAYWIGRTDAVELGSVGCHGYWEWESTGLDVPRFRRAWDAVLRRHEMLRAIVLPDGTQRVLTDLPEYELPVLDLRTEPPAAAEQQAGELREELSHRVLPADRWPLWDVRLTLLPDDRVRLHLGLDLLIIDAWSYFHILVPDLVGAYAAMDGGDDPTGGLTPLELTFRDYVSATSGEALESSEDYRRSREYWLSRLDEGGLPPAPDLPKSGAGGTKSGRFTRRRHHLPVADWARLQARGKAASLTPTGVVVAAFAEVLRTWSRGDRFTINFPLFNRLPLHPAVDDLIGDFTTTSLLAVEKTDGTFEERARSVQEQLWTDLEHRHFGGVRVMRELARRADGAVRAAFPIVVTSLLGQPPRHFTTALGETVYTSTQTPQVTLDFQVSEVAGALEFSWDSLDEEFPPGLLADMFAAYCALLERLVADPEAWHSARFDLLPAAQRALREEVNATSADLPELLLHTPVARHAALRPDAIAVAGSERRLTYAELDRRVNQVGRVLRAAGARPNRLVAVVLDKGWEQIVAAHGVLASGAAYLPIDPAAPADRLRALLADGEVELVVTQHRLVDAVAWPEDVRLLLVDRDFDDADAAPLASVQTAEDLAYVIYTSGSTGKPKGVMVAHSGAANTILDINRRFAVGPDDRCIAVSGLHFDLSVYDVFGMIEAGGTVVVPDPYDIPDPAAWAELAAREGVTFWNSVPALIEVLVNHLEGLRDTDTDILAPLAGLRLAVLAGDWIPTTLPDRLRELAPRATVIGSGGPTETCVWSVIYPIGEVDPNWPSIPYGKPMTNQRYHVLDAELRPCPVWVPGEIHVGSPVGLARGYWRDEERTAAKFFPLPQTGERVYASGDLGRYLPDGNIEILGREDFQVKIQGYRIELGEIEAALADHAAVDRAVVVAVGAARHSRRLAAFVTARSGAEVDPAELQRFVATTLPTYMVPATVLPLDALPLTGNGKIDRMALTTLADDAGAGHGGEFVEPSTPLEQAMALLWQDLLDVEGIGAHDHFFQLGGDSVKATALVGRVRELLGAELALRTIFAEPTLRGTCATLAADPVHGEPAEAMAAALLALTAEDLADVAD